MTPPNHETLEARTPGFSLKSVCWGYREIFARTLEGLFEEGAIGDGREETTRHVLGLLRKADRSCFDYVLKEFLCALNPRTRWLMDLPGVFGDVTTLGRELAEAKHYHGINYFRTLGEGGFGDTPRQVRDLVGHVRVLRRTDDAFAMAFLRGYRALLDRLTPHEIERYIREGLRIYETNPKSAARFMEGRLKASEAIIATITRECRLEDIAGELAAFVSALGGTDVEVGTLSALDADGLIERDTSMVCLYRWLYLPLRIRHFHDASLNRSWYRLMAVVAGGMLAWDSFPRIHGHPDFPTAAALVGEGTLELNLFQAIEFARVLRRIVCHWPGARRLVAFGLRVHRETRRDLGDAERLMMDLVEGAAPLDCARKFLDGCVNCFAVADWIGDGAAELFGQRYPDLDATPMPAMRFLPDFLFPANPSVPPSDQLVVDLREKARRQSDDTSAEDDQPSAATSGDSDAGAPNEEGADAVPSAFVYDEWSQSEGAYYEGYCLLRELRPEAGRVEAPHVVRAEDAQRIRRVFERLKPEVARREKYLSEGDSINADLLVDFMVLRRREPTPRVRFYEKPLIRQRDLAVQVLLDASGSTNEAMGEDRVITIEQRAALLLGEGLAILGDRFSICGFNSNGRLDCAYAIYKDFDDPWDADARRRVLAAHPSQSTRMGPALRHSGWRLGQIDAQQRLIVLITDGKPMDSEYDPRSRYAQHDVRMACEENARRCVHTFALSTEENTQADMELMFPRRRFAILSDFRDLPRILPQLYIGLTF